MIRDCTIAVCSILETWHIEKLTNWIIVVLPCDFSTNGRVVIGSEKTVSRP